MKLLILAARNLRRNTRRTALTLLAIAFGLSMMIVSVVLNEGMYDQMIKTGVSQIAGHVVVEEPTWLDDPEPGSVVTDASGVAATLAGLFPDAVITPRLQLGGLLTSPSNSVGAGLQGMDPVAEKDILDLSSKIVDGEWLEGGDDRGILVGRAMADSLGVGIGDKVVFMGQFGGEEVQSRLFRVRGIFRTGSAEMDGFLAFCSLKAAQDLLGMGDVAHMVAVHLADEGRTSEATDEARAALHRDDVSVMSWQKALPDIYGMIRVDRKSNDILLAILGLIIAMGVLNTVLMSVLERTREFGVVLSIGMKPAQVARLVLSEGFVLGLVGAALGVLGGIALGYPLVVHGVDFAAMMGTETMDMSGISISAQVYGTYAWWRIGLYSATAVLFTVLSAVWPAIHVARLKPVDALHHV